MINTSLAASLMPAAMLDRAKPHLHPLHGVGRSAAMDGGLQEFWAYRLTLNLFCYATLLAPVFLLVRLLRVRGHLDVVENMVEHGSHKSSGIFYRTIALFLVGNSKAGGAESKLPDTAPTAAQTRHQQMHDWMRFSELALLLVCFCGLQGAYLTWGVLQEKIMTQEYALRNAVVGSTSNEKNAKFKDSLFLVFMNRISAFLLAGLYISVVRQPPLRAPLYKFSYASFSNIMSSWFQYEALKYITFPAQVLGKASKVIPVMLMGKLVSKKSFPAHQYATAFLISAGVSLFLLSRDTPDAHSHKKYQQTMALSGVVLMIGYLTFDSFTSTWQSDLFQQYRMSSTQMMCGVNLFSSLLTLVSLVLQGGFMESVRFALVRQGFILDISLLSICSAVGQLFIFYTINQFGAVTFTIIMTIRQALAILLSCIIYGHEISATGVLGVIVVFIAMLLRTYFNTKDRKRGAVRPSAVASNGQTKEPLILDGVKSVR